MSLDKNNLSKRREKVLKKGKCIKIHLLKTKMAIYSVLYCSVMYFINQQVNAATVKFRKFRIEPVASLKIEQFPNYKTAVYDTNGHFKDVPQLCSVRNLVVQVSWLQQQHFKVTHNSSSRTTFYLWNCNAFVVTSWPARPSCTQTHLLRRVLKALVNIVVDR